MDAVELLKADHQKVKQLFQQFESGSDEQKEQVFREIVKELQIHTQVEEEVFYPAVHDIDSEMAAEAVEEHNIVDFIIGEMEKLSPEDEAYKAKFTTLKENIEHHIEEEEGEMFPEAKEKLPDIDMLGQEMMELKQRLMEGWSDGGRRTSGRRGGSRSGSSSGRSRSTSGTRSSRSTSSTRSRSTSNRSGSRGGSSRGRSTSSRGSR
jgi:hemerythrin superfamily protein